MALFEFQGRLRGAQILVLAGVGASAAHAWVRQNEHPLLQMVLAVGLGFWAVGVSAMIVSLFDDMMVEVWLVVMGLGAASLGVGTALGGDRRSFVHELAVRILSLGGGALLVFGMLALLIEILGMAFAIAQHLLHG